MPAEALLTDLARTIQLAVAPVFLLTALGTLLNVLSTRLGRIVDRARHLSEQPRSDLAPAAGATELRGLAQRRKLINYAITCATAAALCVCLVTALLFLGFMLENNFSRLIALLFIAAMTLFIGALLLFLREVVIALTTIRIDVP